MASPGQLVSAQRPSARGSSIRRRVLILALLLALAMATAALFLAAASGSIDGWLPRSELPGTAAALAAATRLTEPVAPSPTSVRSVGGADLRSTATPSPARTPSLTSATATAKPVAIPQVRHVVRRGETLVSIAARFGVTPQSIRRLNHIKDPNLIHVGQRLVIPALQ